MGADANEPSIQKKPNAVSSTAAPAMPRQFARLAARTARTQAAAAKAPSSLKALSCLGAFKPKARASLTSPHATPAPAPGAAALPAKQSVLAQLWRKLNPFAKKVSIAALLHPPAYCIFDCISPSPPARTRAD